MNSEQAQFVLGFLMPQITEETKITRRVIEAVPAERSDYRPDPASKTALELAWHIASSEVWFLEGVATGSFPMEDSKIPESIKTPQDILSWYDAGMAVGQAKVSAMSGEQLANSVSFFNVFNYPAVVYLNFMIKHSVHHRGQLSAYLRAMGSKVPSIYGGSADEPFEMTAQA
jgi:uncharacterized damage-inducible protein DinB